MQMTELAWRSVHMRSQRGVTNGCTISSQAASLLVQKANNILSSVVMALHLLCIATHHPI